MTDVLKFKSYYVESDGEIAVKSFDEFETNQAGTKTTYTGIRDEQTDKHVTRLQYDARVAAFNGLSDQHKSIFKKEAQLSLMDRSARGKGQSPLAPLDASQRQKYEAALVAAGLADAEPDGAGCYARNKRDMNIIADYFSIDKAAYNTHFFNVNGHRVPKDSMTPAVISYAMGSNKYKTERLLVALKEGDPQKIRSAYIYSFGPEAEHMAASPMTLAFSEALKTNHGQGREIKVSLPVTLHADGAPTITQTVRSQQPLSQARQQSSFARPGM